MKSRYLGSWIFADTWNVNQIFLKVLFLASLASIVWKCASQKPALNSQATVRLPPKEIELSEEKRRLILRSTSVEYFEIPGLQEISDPRELQTFSIPVRNETCLDQFRKLTTRKTNSYSSNPPAKCIPHYISALVFHYEGKKETILYSLDCGSLYLYEEKLYLNLSSDTMEVEKIFRQIRSGR